jgi:hypothetical protein
MNSTEQWQCPRGNCGAWFDDRNDALICCGTFLETRHVCGECEEGYADEVDANECCNTANEICPHCHNAVDSCTCSDFDVSPDMGAKG